MRTYGTNYHCECKTIDGKECPVLISNQAYNAYTRGKNYTICEDNVHILANRCVKNNKATISEIISKGKECTVVRY